MTTARPDPERAARALVRDRFPEARQAWLAGSVVHGRATATSDLDVTVLLDETDVRRESLVHEGWPVELFVHTAASVRHFVGVDLARRRPTMARLVATGVPLLAGDAGADLVAECAAALAAGPGPLPAADLALARYALSDLLDDLEGVAGGPLATAVAVETWRSSAELLLASSDRWGGTGKWLVREVEALDADLGTTYASRLDSALRDALGGDPERLTSVADEVLDRVGGRLWAGYTASASLPPA